MEKFNLFNIKNKVALITGGRRGIGRALAIGLAKAGARIAIVSKSPTDIALIQELKKINGPNSAAYIQCDLLDREARSTVIDKALSHFETIDILINNAGNQNKHPAIDYPLSIWDSDIELLLNAVMDISQQAAKIMITKGQGSIIHIASISSFQGARNISAYSTAKHALVGLTKCMANEWARHGINVNAIAPGIIETDMSKDTLSNIAQKSEILGRIPSGKLGTPQDLIGPTIFLCSEASRHVHGHTLLVDGGWLGR